MSITVETIPIFCFYLALVFFFFALFYVLLRGKAVFLIPGFNIMTEKQGENYDIKQIAKDRRNRDFLYSGIFLVGTVLTYVNWLFIFPVVAVWLYFVIKNTHLSFDKEYSKYKITPEPIIKERKGVSYKKVKKHHPRKEKGTTPQA